jgi:CheY-like chemotaxis protein
LFEGTSLLPSRRQRDQGGAGLGLSLCRDIVQHYGGRIWAKNGSRCGAELHFTLPALAVGFVPELLGVKQAQSLRVLLLIKNSVLADCAVRALRLNDIDSRVCVRLQDVFMVMTTWTPDVIVVSPSFAWQLSDTVQDRIRKLGASHILMFSQTEGFVEVSPPTHIEPLLTAIARLASNGAKLLVVDDDPEYGSVIEFELAQAGYAVERAYNGVDAVTAVADKSPAVLILDLALPQLDGFGVLEELASRELPVSTIVLTALDDASVEARLRQQGAAEVFRKFELIHAAGAQEAGRVREILTPVLAANPSEVSREAGVLSNASNAERN